MPAPKSTDRAATYVNMGAARAAFGESNDCGVVAVAAACRVTYEKAHGLLKLAGRVDGHGTPVKAILSVCTMLGFNPTRYHLDEFKSLRYTEGRARFANHVTTHHADRFPGVFRDGESWLLLTGGGRHIAAVVDGVNCDWTRGKAQRVYMMWKVEPL